MHSIYNTGLPIKQFAQIFGLHPWFLAQIGTNLSSHSETSVFSLCNDVTFEYTWQDVRINRKSQVSRTMIAEAIEKAEEVFALYTHYYPAPRYIAGETQPFPEHFDRRLAHHPLVRTPRWNPPMRFPIKAVTDWKYVRKFGKETWELINSAVAVTRYDSNGDGINDKFSLSFTISDEVADDEIVVAFTDADRDGEDVAEWRVNPLRITVDRSVSPVSVSVVGDSYQIVRPALYLAMEPQSLDVSDSLIYVATLDVWRRWYDPEQAGEIVYANGCTEAVTAVCASPDDYKMGVAALYDLGGAANIGVSCSGTEPVSIRLNYIAGYPLHASGAMERRHARIIALMAAARMECLPCGCACGEDKELLSKWAEPPQLRNARGSYPLLSMRQQDNRFGPEKGNIEAWEQARELKLYTARAIPGG